MLSSLPLESSSLTPDAVYRRLTAAIDQMDLAKCEALLAQGAFDMAPANVRVGVTEYAIRKGFSDGVIAFLEFESRDKRPVPLEPALLFAAAKAGDLAVCQTLVRLGASVNETNYSDMSPLCVAAHKGHANVCAYLLEQGADPNNGSDSLRHPLHEALSLDHVETCRVLVAAGADPGYAPPVPRGKYLTPFQSAIAFSTPAVASYFIATFPQLLHISALDGRSIVELADGYNKELVLAALAEQAIAANIDVDASQQPRQKAAEKLSPL